MKTRKVTTNWNKTSLLSIHLLIFLQFSSNKCKSNSVIRPNCSNKGINLSGVRSPLIGCLHLASASHPTIVLFLYYKVVGKILQFV